MLLSSGSRTHTKSRNPGIEWLADGHLRQPISFAGPASAQPSARRSRGTEAAERKGNKVVAKARRRGGGAAEAAEQRRRRGTKPTERLRLAVLSYNYPLDHTERCQSGLSCSPGKTVCAKTQRGFESLPLRFFQTRWLCKRLINHGTFH